MTKQLSDCVYVRIVRPGREEPCTSMSDAFQRAFTCELESRVKNLLLNNPHPTRAQTDQAQQKIIERVFSQLPQAVEKINLNLNQEVSHVQE